MSPGAGDLWLAGLEPAARDLLPAPVFDYIQQGAGHGITASEAQEAWRAFRFVPRVLRDVTDVDLRTSVLGTQISALVAVAPTTLQRLVHPDGELAMARACAATGSLMVVSSNAGTSFRDIGATGVPWWLQAYVTRDRSLTGPVLEAAVRAGTRAIVLTVDTPVVATKLRTGADFWGSVPTSMLRVNFPELPESVPGGEKATDLGPADIAWLGQETGLPVVVKGVLHPEDARLCIEAGAEAVWVSNHGGRQLDRAIATSAALPAVVEAVGDSGEVFVDGGIGSPLDVLGALAAGARCAFLGRLPLWALVQGEESVVTMHEFLVAGLAEAMRLVGAAEPRHVSGTAVCHVAGHG